MLAQPLTILSNRNDFFYFGKDKVTLLTMLAHFVGCVRNDLAESSMLTQLLTIISHRVTNRNALTPIGDARAA
jgi:hypothetical protein